MRCQKVLAEAVITFEDNAKYSEAQQNMAELLAAHQGSARATQLVSLVMAIPC